MTHDSITTPAVGDSTGRFPFTELRVPTPKGDLYVRDYQGDGPAFVLMHGFPDNLRIYDLLAPPLVEAGRRTVTFDFLGFGQSGKASDGSYSFHQQLDDLKAVVNHLGLDKIIPVAHDAAGPAALNFSIDHPEKTASLVVLNAVFADSAVATLPELVAFFATPALRKLALKALQAPEQFQWIAGFQGEQFRNSLSEQYWERYDSFLRPIINANFTQQGAGLAFAQMTSQLLAEQKRNTARIPLLKTLDIPVKLIWGQSDPYLNVDFAKEFQSYFRQATLTLVPGGHWPQIDDPLLVAKAMLS